MAARKPKHPKYVVAAERAAEATGMAFVRHTWRYHYKAARAHDDAGDLAREHRHWRLLTFHDEMMMHHDDNAWVLARDLGELALLEREDYPNIATSEDDEDHDIPNNDNALH